MARQYQQRQSSTFEDYLIRLLVETRDQREGSEFFPNNIFTTLITDAVVSRELCRCPELRSRGPAYIDNITQTVCGARSFKKIFVLLVLVDKLPLIPDFIAEDVADDDLPLGRVSQQTSKSFRLGRGERPREALHCFDSWNFASIRNFAKSQWLTLAPTFEKAEHKTVKHVVLSHQHPLPFIKDGRPDSDVKIRQGGHSDVFIVDIHPDHHNFHGVRVGCLLIPSTQASSDYASVQHHSTHTSI